MPFIPKSKKRGRSELCLLVLVDLLGDGGGGEGGGVTCTGGSDTTTP